MEKYLLAMFIATLYSISAICQKVDSVISSYASKGIHIEVPMGFSSKETLGQWADFRGELNSMELMYKVIEPPYQQQNIANLELRSDESLYWAIALATVKNLSEEEQPKIAPLPSEAVSKDFNANLGFICLFTPKSTVTEYKYAFIVGLHKSGSSDIFVMLLSHDIEKLKQALPVLVFGKIKYQ